ncbi:hypothetical protein Taro_044377 [Colocasia esculenta]|uniref:Fucosyltransferase n=1 Tax=Colocasia esculenta TaxID=4460 RepID=A0A843X5E1_COLES|nr:hypothetical protein [Colocasia esculenta]
MYIVSNVVTADAILLRPPGAPKDKYLGGLLAAGFDESSCLSRYQATIYRKPSPHKPSPYLVERLRKYEEHHRRCAPGTAAYDRALRLLDADTAPANATEYCRYVLWGPYAGLGNRILSLASSFLYALLTDRVLLIDPGKDLTSLFCEPFPNTTWLLPPGFPITRFEEFKKKNRQSYANLLIKKKISNDAASGGPRPPPFVYAHLGDTYSTEDMYFFCERDQAAIRTVPWLLVKSNLYFVPPLFLNQEFEPELARLFPEKETVFHHLGRYLFHPTNKVWRMVASYYRAYLAAAGERLGVQIRIFSHWDAPFDVVSEQVVNCLHKEKLLPAADALAAAPVRLAAEPNNTTAVLITSLDSGYFEKIRSMYWEHPVAGGVAVTVHQPTHEGTQKTGRTSHDEKAWAEINLLSLADVLVTSAWSTFGYVAQGLAGIRPWVLVRVEKGKMPEPTCLRDISMEPCLHKPPWYVCRERRNGDNAKVVPFATHCPDLNGGLKLVDRT